MSDIQIKLSVSLSDGSFESNLQFPIAAVAEHKDELVGMWLNAMRVGLGQSTSPSPTETEKVNK